jgi:hypothetical protein
MSNQTTSTTSAKIKFTSIGFLLGVLVGVMICYFVTKPQKGIVGFMGAPVSVTDANTMIADFRADVVHKTYKFPKSFLIEKEYLQDLMYRRKPDGTIINNNGIVIYPCVKSNPSDPIFKYSLIFAGCNYPPSASGVYVRPNDSPSDDNYIVDKSLMYEYVFPCPNDCPDAWGYDDVQ